MLLMGNRCHKRLGINSDYHERKLINVLPSRRMLYYYSECHGYALAIDMSKAIKDITTFKFESQWIWKINKYYKCNLTYNT